MSDLQSLLIARDLYVIHEIINSSMRSPHLNFGLYEDLYCDGQKCDIAEFQETLPLPASVLIIKGIFTANFSCEVEMF